MFSLFLAFHSRNLVPVLVEMNFKSHCRIMFIFYFVLVGFFSINFSFARVGFYIGVLV